MSVEAQLKCDCGERDLVVASTGSVEVGQQTSVKMSCSGCGSLQRTVTVVYDPDEYDLKDPYGSGEFEIKSECRGCAQSYYGPMGRPCYQCGCEDFDRSVEVNDS